MSKQRPIEIFMPPNMLKAKVGGVIAGLDMAAIKRAEKALGELKAEFGNWMNTDVAALGAARDAYGAARSAETRGKLYRASHDLRGQALTFEFPVVARIAASLCRLLDGADGTDGTDDALPLALIDAHVNAVRVIVRQNVKESDNQTARALVAELDARVIEYLKKPKQKR